MTEYKLAYNFINVWSAEIFFLYFLLDGIVAEKQQQNHTYMIIQHSYIQIHISFHTLVAADLEDDNVTPDSKQIS